ncbi:lysylphosphatidylglycerol synthase transmembrane domain-containing protein [Polyangium sp. y55x31]|uniref:lysylphosphatidylglycerol synthase transmembrane domain-containing protein n=1 Tax=Polyangium sp. y55x31 TaxID=3042688 RepID=UPI00248225C0|nr:lysylphosphatidylglycerol synthase transmembrane domain-containing protein [Polyangium sp. y55x31]MDI1482058.1 lysylphosphatidylglycerol synthase transmembrane domain-containing protein [Polyangium sp. y55x31]
MSDPVNARGSGSPKAPFAPNPSPNEASKKAAPRSLVRLAVRLVGPVLLVVVLLRVRDARAAWDALATASLLPLGLAFVLNAASYWLKIIRSDVLLSARGYDYPRKRAWLGFLSSVFVGMFTPGRVGDVLRAQYFRHDLGMPYSEGIAVVVVDRLCDLYVLVGFVAVGVARWSSVVVGDLAFFTWGGVLLTALGPLVLFVPSFAQTAMRALYKKMPGDPTGEGFDRFLLALRAQRPRHLASAVVLTLLAFGVNYVQGYLIAQSLHFDLAFYDVVCLLAVASLLGLLPISVSGLGVREFFFSVVFPALGLPGDAGLIYGLVVFLVIYVGVAAMGFVGWYLAPPPFGDKPERSAAGAER